MTAGPVSLLKRGEPVRITVANDTGGRVTVFLGTDDFARDYVVARGVEFVRPPQTASYGTVAVFKGVYGNLWDLVEPHP